ncbi:alpha/beta fold hydrolase [Actinoallomurus acanthiterrae]
MDKSGTTCGRGTQDRAGRHGPRSAAPARGRRGCPLTALRNRPVYLVGNSYGGILAARMAVTVPDRVAGLVLIEGRVRAAAQRRARP